MTTIDPATVSTIFRTHHCTILPIAKLLLAAAIKTASAPSFRSVRVLAVWVIPRINRSTSVTRSYSCQVSAGIISSMLRASTA